MAEAMTRDHPNPSNLSEVSDVIELLLSHADVAFTKEETARMEAWERYVSWVDRACVSGCLMAARLLISPVALCQHYPIQRPSRSKCTRSTKHTRRRKQLVATR